MDEQLQLNEEISAAFQSLLHESGRFCLALGKCLRDARPEASGLLAQAWQGGVAEVALKVFVTPTQRVQLLAVIDGEDKPIFTVNADAKGSASSLN